MSQNQAPRNEFFREDWILASQAVSLLRSRLHETNSLRLFYKKVGMGTLSAAYGMEASGVWLIGESGAGKTTALDECERRLCAAIDLDSEQPVLRISLLPAPTMHRIVRALLVALNYPFAQARAFDELVQDLFNAMKTRRVRAVLLDEAHHIVRGNRPAHLVDIRDLLKRMLDETNVCLVIAGLPSVTKLRENDDQLLSRLPAEINLSAGFSVDEWKAFAAALQRTAPIAFDSDASQHLVDALVTRRKTSVRLLARVIEEATKIAALGRAALITKEHVLHAVSFTFLLAVE